MAENRDGVNQRETRQNVIDQNSPEILTNPIYTPGFLREQIGKLMRVEFLIGTNNLVDRIGILQDVGASYILLRSIKMIVWFIVIFIQLNLLQYQQLEFMEEIIIDIIITNIIVAKIKRKLYDNEYID